MTQDQQKMPYMSEGTLPDIRTLHARWGGLPIKVEDLFLDDLLTSPYCYEQGLVHWIHGKNEASVIQDRLSEVGQYFAAQSLLAHNESSTFKIEGMEKSSRLIWEAINQQVNGNRHGQRIKPFSCHCFIANAENSPSFPIHTDPDPVLMYMVEGMKCVYVVEEDKWYTLEPGDTLFLQAGVAHRISNPGPNVMLSIGYDRFHLEKIKAYA